jgi:hypothetical protein
MSPVALIGTLLVPGGQVQVTAPQREGVSDEASDKPVNGGA